MPEFEGVKINLTQLILLAILQAVTLKAQVPWNPGTFVKTELNPILGPDSAYRFFCPVQQRDVQWQKADLFNPAAVVRDGKVYMLFRAEDNPAAILGGRTSRIGLAWSEDGIHFTKAPKPVLYPDKDAFSELDYPGGCEDPRVVETPDGRYVMAYTSWNGKTARLSIAISPDLEHWEKKGPAFWKAYDGKFKDRWSKSGSIITEWKNGKYVAWKHQGKYWMYWGEHFINLAWSEDLANWFPSVNSNGELTEIVKTRPGKFDSDLTECGPPAVLTDKGIVLLYNGKNANDDKADPNIPRGSYTVGEIIFDPMHPDRVLRRSDKPFLQPSLAHETSGQYKAGTTFAEGLVYFKNRWFLYYGTADSFVGLAIKEPNND
jgi:predicted GH43/DUF377 family glycosyl hydrolase